MKRIVETTEASGLESLLGEYVQVWCFNYIYAGRLTGVNEHDIVLSEAGVVYETGALDAKAFQDFQRTPGDIFIRIDKIEAYFAAPQLGKS